METRLQATLALARELVDDIELSRLAPEGILLKSLRLARLAEDPAPEQWLRFELNGYTDTPAARIWMVKFGRLSAMDSPTGYWLPLAGVAGTIAALQAEIQTLQLPSINYSPSSANPNEWVGGFQGSTADKMVRPIQTVLQRVQSSTTSISTLSSIQSRVLAAIHEFAVAKYHALLFESLADSIFNSHRAAIDERLAEVAPDVLEKVVSIYERLSAGDVEAVSQAMNTVRRMIKSVADQLYPPSDVDVVRDGTTYTVGSDKVLNRIKLYLKDNCLSASRQDRLSRSIRDIHERASAGTHADVTPAEARALFLGAYLTLGEVLECGSTAAGV